MNRTLFLTSVILVVSTRLIFCSDIKDVTNYDEFIKAANGSKAALLINIKGSGNCTNLTEQMTESCQKAVDLKCFTCTLTDKTQIDSAFQNLTVEWTPYLAFFENNTKVCSLDKECDAGDTDYVLKGFKTFENATQSLHQNDTK